MSTYRELVYIVSDLAKTLSDDTTINENHIVFLLNKYRTYLLKQKYEKSAYGTLPRSAYQTICLDLTEVNLQPSCSGDSCLINSAEDKYLKSTKEVPTMFDSCNVKIAAENFFKTEVAMISPDRMGYVGHSKWLKNTIYGTIYYDNHLYLKSMNPNLYGGDAPILKRIHLTAVFDNPQEAFDMVSCDGDGCPIICDFMDEQFPMEDALETQLISLVLKEIVGAAFRPKDTINNAKDDLADIASFVRQNLKDRNNLLNQQ